MLGDRLSASTSAVSPVVGTVETAVESAVGGGRAVAVSVCFWTAVCLPFLLAGFLGSGIGTPTEGIGFVAAIAIEALALVGGRGYGTESG